VSSLSLFEMLNPHHQNDTILAGIDLSELYDAAQGARDLLETALAATGAQRVVLVSIKRNTVLIEAEAFASGDPLNVRIHPRVFGEEDTPRAIIEAVARSRTPLAIDDLNALYPRSSPYAPPPHSMLCLPAVCSRSVIGAILLTGEGIGRLTPADRYALELMTEQALLLLGHPDPFEARQNASAAAARAKLALDTVQQEIGAALRFDSINATGATRPSDFQARLSSMLERADSGVRWLDRGSPPAQRDGSALWRVLSDTTRTLKLIAELRELLNGSAARQGRFDLNEVVLDSLASHGTRLRHVNVRIDTQHLHAGELPVFGDSLLVSQAVSQAFSNAIDAMADIRNRERILAVRCERTDTADIRLEIADSGTGAEGELEQLFTAFYTTRPEKLGLGLALIRLIFELHNGSVMIEPNFPHGLIFRAILPARI